MRILSSASKIVLLLFAVSACLLTWFGKLDPKDFMVLATGVFMYYFSTSKPSGPPSTI